MSEMLTVQVVQFLRPYGVERHCTAELKGSDLDALYRDMLRYHCRFEAEELQHFGEISVTITNEDGDVDVSVTPNGPEVQAGMAAMLRREEWVGKSEEQTHAKD